MTHRKFTLLALCSLALLQIATSTQAREDWFGLTYDISIPVGDTREFIDVPGWRGFGLEGRSFVTDNINTGFVLGWHNLYQKLDDEVVQVENITITGTQARYIDFIHVLAGVNYHFLDRSYRLRPYVGAKAGLYWIKQRVEIGFVDVTIAKNWHVGVAPEVGITFLTNAMDIHGFVSSDITYIWGRDDSIDYIYAGISLGLMIVF